MIELRGQSGQTGQGFAARFSPADNHLVTSTTDRTARIWDVDSGRVIARWDADAARFAQQVKPYLIYR